MIDPFAVDSPLWFGVCLGLLSPMVLRPWSRALSILLTGWANGVIERRAHRRTIRQLRQDAKEELQQ